MTRPASSNSKALRRVTQPRFSADAVAIKSATNQTAWNVRVRRFGEKARTQLDQNSVPHLANANTV